MNPEKSQFDKQHNPSSNGKQQLHYNVRPNESVTLTLSTSAPVVELQFTPFLAGLENTVHGSAPLVGTISACGNGIAALKITSSLNEQKYIIKDIAGGISGSNTTNTLGGFGQTNTGFGATAQANNSIFGKPFGATTTTQSGFGFENSTSTAATPFGQAKPPQLSTSTAATTEYFGQQPQAAGGIFGSQSLPDFGMTHENRGTAFVKYQPTMDSDKILYKGCETNITVKQFCITLMKEYADKSLEELRLEDYLAGRKGPQNNGFDDAHKPLVFSQYENV